MKGKFLLDIIMTVVMLCLVNTNITGLMLHEILGLGIFLLFLMHKVLNFKWIKAVTTGLFQKKLTPKAKLRYAVDVALLLLVILNVATGILISTHIFTQVQSSDIALTSRLHHILAYSLLAVLVVHIGLHWSFITNAAKIKAGSAGEKIICCIASAALVAMLMSSNTVRKYFIPHKDTESYQQTEEPSHKEEDGQDPPPVPDVPTLEQFLSKLICTGCGQRCLLTNPSCGRGRDQQENAIREYNQTYQTNETYSSDIFIPSGRPNKHRR